MERFRRAALLLHRWLGLGAALIVSFLGLTGAAMVFRPELDARLNPRLLRVEPRPNRASLESTYQEVRARFPNRKISFYFAPASPEDAGEWWLDKGKLRVITSPYSGDILGTRTANDGVFAWLFEAHTHLFAGDTGELIAGWSGLVLACLSLSGLVLWWPRKTHGAAWKRALSPQLRTNWRGRIYELHRAGGFYLSGLLLLSSLTGAALVWPDSAKIVVSFLGVSTPPKKKAASGQSLTLDALLQKADAAFPEGRLTRITFPTKAGAPLVVRKKLPDELHPNGMNSIALDATNGQVLWLTDSRRVSMGERLMNLRYPLHTGVWGGLFSRVLLVFVGLSPLLFSISGFLMWLTRRKAHLARQSPK